MKFFKSLLVALMSLTMLVGCSGEKTEINLTFDAYSMHEMAMLHMENADGEVEQFGCMDFTGYKGDSVKSILNESNYVSVSAVCDYCDFEGWMEYEVTYTTDEDGFDIIEYTRVSDTLYTTEEVLEMKLPKHNVMFTAKWADMSMDEYYVEESDTSTYDGYTGVLALTANGGKIAFTGSAEYEVKGTIIGLQENELTLNDSFNNEDMPYSLEISNDGAKLTGWTVYEADALDCVYEKEDDGREYYWYNNEDGEDVYIVLTNGTIYNENATTEEVYNIEIGDKAYFAVANWE